MEVGIISFDGELFLDHRDNRPMIQIPNKGLLRSRNLHAGVEGDVDRDRRSHPSCIDILPFIPVTVIEVIAAKFLVNGSPVCFSDFFRIEIRSRNNADKVFEILL